MVKIQDKLLHDLISAFRPGYNCQYVLLHVIENFKAALDKGEVVGVLTTDLSKAFDCLSPLLLYKKLLAYGFSAPAAELIYDYLSNRSHCTKIGSISSPYVNIVKGTPQGSKLGPVLFNFFINDILYYALPIL